MKLNLLILFNFLALNVNCQWLFEFKRPYNGTIFPVVQGHLQVNLPDSTFKKKYASNNCQDSIFVVRTDGYGSFPDIDCADNFDFGTRYYPKLNVVNFNPFEDPDLDVKKTQENWTFSEKNIWRYQRNYEDQTWEFDKEGRLTKVKSWYNSDSLISTQEYFYGPNNNLNRITKAGYHENISGVFHNQWFDDEKGRIWMRIDYNGQIREFSKGQLKNIATKIENNLTKSRDSVALFLDSLDIELAVVYKYGLFGLETSNACFRGRDYCYTNRVSDSLFYDKKGRLIRFHSYPSRYAQPNCLEFEFLFNYKKHTNQLTQVVEHRYSNQQLRDWWDYKVVQTIQYNSKKISSVHEIRSTVWRQYIDGKYIDAVETIGEEIQYDYAYRH